MSSLKPYSNENPSPLSRRFFAFAIDLVIILVLHIITFVVSTNILSGSDSFKSRQTILQQEMVECYKITEESKVYEFKGTGEEKYNNPVEQEEMFLKWAYSHIKKSYNTDNSVFIKYGVTSLDIDPSIPEASYTSDNIAYFYHTFVKEKNDTYEIIDLKSEAIDQYYYRFFKKHAFSYNDVSLWIYDDVNNTIPILKGNFAYNLYNYLKIDTKSQEGLSCYNLLAKSYQNMWNEEVDQLINCKQYQLHYTAYNNQYHSLSISINLDSFISYVCIFLLAYVLPTILFKKHQTIGKKILKVLPVDVEGYRMVGWQITVRDIAKFFGFFGFTIVSNFLSAGSNSAWIYPMFYIGNLGISLLTIDIVFLIIAFASFLVGAFTNKKRDFADLFTHCYVIDIRDYMDHNKEAIEISKKEEEDNSVEEVVVIDSSTIKK